MLREELEFKIRMRNSLHGIQHLDPDTIPKRLVELDAEIAGLRVKAGCDERPSPALEIVPIGTAVKAA